MHHQRFYQKARKVNHFIAETVSLALQLHISFKMGFLGFGLVSSSPG